MRSDWDKDHGKHGDLQRRYPTISQDEWRYIHRLLGASLAAQLDGGSPTATTRLRQISIRYTEDLIHKVERRIEP